MQLYFFKQRRLHKVLGGWEIIQCAVCQTELIINKDLQFEVLDLKSSVEHPQ
jgi:hypothetical protein